jgi:hypothetical protein
MALCTKTGTKQGARRWQGAKLCRVVARGLRRRVHGRESYCPTPVSRFRFRRPAISNRQFLVRLETSVTSSKHTAEHITNRHFSEGVVVSFVVHHAPQKIDNFTCRNFFGSLRKSPSSRRKSAVAPVRLS